MRSDRYKKTENKKEGGFYAFTRFWAVLFVLVSAAFFCVIVYMDLLTVKYLCIGGGIVAGLLLLLFPALFFRNFKKSRKILCLVLSLLIMAVYGVGIAYAMGTLDFIDKITTGDDGKAPENAKTVDVTNTPFNFYVSGLDMEGSIAEDGRSDVNMIVTVNPNTHKILLTSLPRDAYIDLKSVAAKDKLTHTGLFGIEETVGVAEELLGLDINYYGKVNYTTVTRLVDAIGGIDVVSDYTFDTHGMGVYYIFYEGENHLDGSRALAFARERKSFADGDLQRNRNQQIVLEGILKKALSSTTILTKYTSILNAVKENVDLNLSAGDIQKLVKMQLADMPSWQIERQSIIGTPDADVCYSEGSQVRSIVILDPESVQQAKDKIVAVMEGKEETAEPDDQA